MNQTFLYVSIEIGTLWYQRRLAVFLTGVSPEIYLRIGGRMIEVRSAPRERFNSDRAPFIPEVSVWLDVLVTAS